jgi:hypothetical protein
MVIVQRKALCIFQDKGIFNNLLDHGVPFAFIYLFFAGRYNSCLEDNTDCSFEATNTITVG